MLTLAEVGLLLVAALSRELFAFSQRQTGQLLLALLLDFESVSGESGVGLALQRDRTAARS